MKRKEAYRITTRTVSYLGLTPDDDFQGQFAQPYGSDGLGNCYKQPRPLVRVRDRIARRGRERSAALRQGFGLSQSSGVEKKSVQQ